MYFLKNFMYKLENGYSSFFSFKPWFPATPNPEYILKPLPPDIDLETNVILKQLVRSHKALAELKGFADTIPNKNRFWQQYYSTREKIVEGVAGLLFK